MTFWRSLRRLAIACAWIPLGNTALAQATGARVARDSACSYDECALRQSGSNVLRGRRGELVLRADLFARAKLSTLMADASDSARAQARQFDRLRRRSMWLAFGAPLVGGSAIAVLLRQNPTRPQAVAGVGVGTLALQAWGLADIASSQRALARAIWWYNR